MTCPNCGATLPDGSVNCMSCGAKFRYAQTTKIQQARIAADESEKRRKHSRLILMTALPLAVVLVAGCLLYFLALSPTVRFNKRLQLADSYYSTGMYSQAAESYDMALRIAQNEPEALFGRARSNYELAKYDAALADYLRLEELQPDYTGLYSGLVNSYMALERWAEAYALLEDGSFNSSDIAYSSTVKTLSEKCLILSGYSTSAVDVAVVSAQIVGTTAPNYWSEANKTLFFSSTSLVDGSRLFYSISVADRAIEVYADEDSWNVDASETSPEWNSVLNVSFGAEYADIIIADYGTHLRELGVLSATLKLDMDDDGYVETVFIASDFITSWRSVLTVPEGLSNNALSSLTNSGITAVVADVSGGELHFRPAFIAGANEIVADVLTNGSCIAVFTRGTIFDCSYTDSDNTVSSCCLSVGKRYNTGSLYAWRYASGEEALHNMDSDDSNEAVTFSVLDGTPQLIIGGTAYNDVDGRLANADTNWYYITDIDKNDEFMEVAILTGSGADAVTMFFRCDATVVYMGSVIGHFGEAGFELEGDGIIVSNHRLSIMQTWAAPANWKLGDNGQITEEPVELYFLRASDYGSNVTVKKDFSAFSERDTESEAVHISNGEKITFTSTDDLNWISFTRDDGVSGWIYLPDSVNILSGTGNLSPSDVFSGLN